MIQRRAPMDVGMLARVTGVTALEVLTVLVVVAVLGGASLAGGVAVLRSQRAKRTQGLVEVVAAAVQSYGQDLWIVPSADGRARQLQLWDWNRDGILDGRPLDDGGGDAATAASMHAAGYGGFAAHCGAALPRGSVDAASGRVLDAWHRPLRIARAAGVYGDGLYGVWSLGPDGLDGAPASAAGADNIRSWR